MKKKINFHVKVKFYFESRYQMTLHVGWTGFKLNWKKMGWKFMKKVLKIYLWIWFWKKRIFKKTNFFEKTQFHASLFENGLKKFQFETIRGTTITYETNSNLKLSKWQQKLMKQIPVWNYPSDNNNLWNPEVVILKPTLMNHRIALRMSEYLK